MKAIAIALLAMLPASITQAQAPDLGGVIIQGPITPGDCVVWLNSNTLGDSGAPCSSAPPATCATGGMDFSQSGCNALFMGG